MFELFSLMLQGTKQDSNVSTLGGGAVETPRLRALLAASQDTRVVYLHAPFDLLYDRCARQALDQQMEIARNYTASLSQRQAELQKRKTEVGAKGWSPAEEDQLTRVQAELSAQNASIVQKKQDLDHIIARYAADKRRWEEIGEKQGMARPVSTSSVSTS